MPTEDEKVRIVKDSDTPRCELRESLSEADYRGSASRIRFLGERWIPALVESYDYQPLWITVRKDQRLVATLPIVEVDSPLSGKRGVSIPFFDFCPPEVSDKEALFLLYRKLMDVGHRRDWKYFEIRGGFEALDGFKPSISFYRHQINLSLNSDEAFSHLKSAPQRAIRKAVKSGVIVRRSNTEKALKEFYKLQCLTRRRHGLPPQPLSFFKNLRESLEADDLLDIFTAYLGDRPISSSVYVRQDEETVHYKYGASDYRYQEFRGNNLVMWEAISYYGREGRSSIDLGRNSTSTQEGLRQYKLSWGAIEDLQHYQKFDLDKNTVISMADNAFGFHNHIFSKLPIALNRALGKLMYRHIA
ncbi:GNAT family N-acetyltransferase [Pelagicoccus albus]|uniref:GNAT family N-acetyltransferase n=1 Tax=Pelagicoccus albus TaxID=415222 RepID=A0A7X1BC51_9BACT|nr:GNAT family N-acetyltransferase [Pelagicoccus albus]MBC2608235.1 GNAT family N-acetyltransferase [Pelagicoccus albus]